MCVSGSIKVEPEATKTPEIKPFNITNDEQQKEKHAANQFFSSLLEDGTFNARGFIRHSVRNPNLLGDLPHVDPFDIEGANYSTADAALDAGMGFAKKKIDDLK